MSSSYGAYVPLQRETLKRTKPKKRHGDWKPETDHTENDEEQAFLNKDASSRVANPRAIDPTNVLSPLPLPFPNQPGPTLEPPQIPIQTSAPVTFYPPLPDPHVSAAVMYVTIAALITTIIFAALWSARGCLEKATVQESEVIRRRARAGLRNEVVPPNERHRRGGLHSSITFPLPSMHIYSHRHGPRATEYIPFRFQRERNEEVFEGGITDDSASRSHRPNIEDSMDRIAWMNAMIGTKNVVVNPDGSKIATCGVETLEGCNKLADRNSTGSQSDVFDYPCPICLGDFEQGQSVRQLLCRHVYHQPCLDPWILYWQPVCPLCKRSVYDVTPLPLPATVTTTRVSQERQSVESM